MTGDSQRRGRMRVWDRFQRRREAFQAPPQSIKGVRNMRSRTKRTSSSSSGGGNRSSKSVTNQLSFNVICLAISVGGDAHTEPCDSGYYD
jgi:hypothetical protein